MSQIKLQHYDHIPVSNELEASWMPFSSKKDTLCAVGKCPVIGNFPPSCLYNQTLIYKDPNETHRVFVVLETPPADVNAWWASGEGKLLNSLLHQQRPEGTSIAIGYLTKCLSPYKAQDPRYKLDPKEVGYCAAHLFEEISSYDPHAVILMGTGSAKAFLGEGSMYNLRKNVHKVRFKAGSDQTLPTIATIAPEFVAKQPYQGAVMRADLAKAFFWARNWQWYDHYSVRSQTVIYPSTNDGIDQFESQLMSLLDRDDPLFVAWDTETESLSKSKNRLYSFGWSDNPLIGYAINIDHPRSTWTDEQKVRIKGIITDFWNKAKDKPNIQPITHNGQFDVAIMKITLGLRIRNNFWDTQNMAHTFEEEFSSGEYREKCFPKYMPTWRSLDVQTEHWMDFNDFGWSNMKKQRGNLAALTTEKVDEYCALDCANTLRVFYALADALNAKSPGAYRSITAIDHKIQYVLAHIETEGCPINTDLIQWNANAANEGSAYHELKEKEKFILALPEVKKLNKFIIGNLDKPPLFANAIQYVNLNSSDHMQMLFYDIIGHEPVEVWEKGETKLKKPTDRAFLDNLIEEKLPGWEVADALRNYRQYTKLCGTFIDGFIANAETHPDFRVRASYDAAKAVTHRLTCRDPNLQQIPRSGESDNKAKGFVKEFISAIDEPGTAIVAADYGTAEVRMGAIASGDSVLAEIFNKSHALLEDFKLRPTVEAFKKLKFEGDAHRSNAAAAYGIPIEQVTKNQRQAAKNVSFLCIYSAEPAPQLAVKIDSTLEEAQEVVNGFLGKFADLNGYLSSRDPIIENYALIHSPFGRPRSLYAALFPELKKEYRHAINQGRNTGIQSSASDMLLLAAYQLIVYIEDNNKKWRLVNVVHDSILAQVPLEEVKEFSLKLKEFMENPGLEDFGFDKEFCALAADFEIGMDYKSTVEWDHTDEHMERIQNWLVNEGGDKTKAPESYFGEVLELSAKVEKAEADGKPADPELVARKEELEAKIEELAA